MVLYSEETNVTHIRIRHSFSCVYLFVCYLFVFVSKEAKHFSLYKGLKSCSISAIIRMLSIPVMSEKLYLIKTFNYKNVEKGFLVRCENVLM